MVGDTNIIIVRLRGNQNGKDHYGLFENAKKEYCEHGGYDKGYKKKY